MELNVASGRFSARLLGDDWATAAACLAHRDLFWRIIEYDVSSHRAPGADGYRAREENTAKAVCAGCACRSECLDYALAGGERYGVWGGTTSTERRRLRRPSTRIEVCGA